MVKMSNCFSIQGPILWAIMPMVSVLPDLGVINMH